MVGEDAREYAGPLFGMIFLHRAVRQELQNLEILASGMSSEATDVDVHDFRERFDQLRGILDQHLVDVKLQHYYPKLHEKVPNLVAPYRLDVEYILKHEQAVQNLIQGERSEIPKVHRAMVALNTIVAMHFDKEEQQLLPLISRKMLLQEITDMHGAAMRSISPKQHVISIPWMFRLNPPESRELMLKGLLRGPANQFNVMREILDKRLPKEDWDDLLTRIPELGAPLPESSK